MNKTASRRTLLVSVAALLACAAAKPLPSIAEEEEDHTIRPGIGLGIVKLGMKSDLVKKTSGNMDGTYKLPSGTKVDYATWHEKLPKDSPTLRFFYDGADKLVQINSDAPVPATADGISCKSTLAEVRAKYKDLKCFSYRCKTGRIEYYDDIKRGIAFEFTGADGGLPKHLYAIIVHLPEKRVLADANEKALARTAK